MAKIVPAQRTFVVSVPNNTGVVVDIAHCLSVLNRRMYRQGMMYYVQAIKCATPAMAGVVYTAPDSWVTQNSWKKGYETWRKMQNEYGDGMGAEIKGKWADFKVNLDDAGLGYVTPVDGNEDAVLLGEWIYSNFVYDDAGTARSPTIHLIGTSTDDSSIGLIEAYGDARNFVSSNSGEPIGPTELTTGFYAQFHGVGDIDDELGTDLISDNDLPPYDLDDYVGGSANADHPMPVDFFATTSEFPLATVGGFVAPCGLVRLHQANSGASAASFLITVAPGPYKGVMASRMGQ